ncbi:MAG: tRNA(Ile)-lysidine synthase [Actinomycetota bacterium]|nr:tRNA(Ile)-lysidine synthase [Actinomycetota bacterium]
MLDQALRRYTDRLVALEGVAGPVVVGCSGGADSSALLALVRARGFDAIATYVDHGLRAGTTHEATLVRGLAQRFQARHHVVTVRVDDGSNLEARARDARYAALEAARDSYQATAILVGHTADDQAETVLLNFLRGSGADGLAGMPAVRGYIRRPLLALRRADTLEICAQLRLAPAHDEMNDDLRHRRVWLRREVMPRLVAGASRDLVPLLVRQADLLRAESAVLDEAVADVAEPGVALDAARVSTLPVALARRAIRRFVGATPASSGDVEAVLGVVRGGARAAMLSGGGRVERTGNRVALIVATGVPEPILLEFPGRAAHRNVEIESWIEEAPPTAWPSGRRTCVVDADSVGSVAVLRAARAGERFRPLGRGGTKTVFAALGECGVPASERASRFVLAANENGVLPAETPWWVLGYRVDDRVRVTSRTRRFLWITATGSAR